MVLLGVLGVEADARLALWRAAVHLRHGHRRAHRRSAPQRDDLVVVEVAGRADDQAVGDVAAAVVVGDLRHRRAGDHLGLAEDAAAQRVVAVDGLGEEVVHAVRTARPRTSRSPRARPRARSRCRGRSGRASSRPSGRTRPRCARRGSGRGCAWTPWRSRRLPRRPCRQALGDLDRREALGALEEQVLEEVREPFLAFALVARARPDPEPEGDGSDRGDNLGHDPYTARKRCELDVLRQ